MRRRFYQMNGCTLFYRAKEQHQQDATQTKARNNGNENYRDPGCQRNRHTITQRSQIFFHANEPILERLGCVSDKKWKAGSIKIETCETLLLKELCGEAILNWIGVGKFTDPDLTHHAKSVLLGKTLRKVYTYESLPISGCLSPHRWGIRFCVNPFRGLE